MNHKDKGTWPFSTNDFVLKDIINPNKIPMIKIIGINNFINLGIKKVWVGKINHIIIVPNTIE